MANPIWTTGGASRLVDLGTVTEGEYVEVPVVARDPQGGSVTYKFLAGKLPSGIRINSAGVIQGSPIITDVENATRTFEFTIRATDQLGLVSDKTFKVTVANINPPVITPRVTNLGEVFDGSFYSLQLQASELNPYATLTWSLTQGELPPGMTLSSTGLLSGFILPLVTYGNNGSFGYNGTPFNEFGYENAPTYQNNTYKFTIKVFDGVNYDSLTYQLYVIAKDLYSADNSKTLISDTNLTIDQDNRYVPIMLTPSQALPEVRSNSKFAFQFKAIDPNDVPISYGLGLTSSGVGGFDQDGTQGFDVIAFDQENLSVPPGLILDVTTGWFGGTVGSQTQAVQTYAFEIHAFETTNPSRASAPVKYTMTILGDITNNISWSTGTDLGIIDNGSISQLSVSAVSHAGKELVYTLVNDTGRLPQGLQLQRSGLIVGQTTFNFFSLDGGTTTIDGVASNFDNRYTFTVQATTVDNTASSQQTFTVLINNFNKTPYENIYLKALPTLDQRTTFLSIVNNNDIFPEDLLYRSSDPWFGRARDIRSLFLAGLNATEVADYIAAMGTNTYRKRIEFSDIKTAQAVDANFNVKYEVVYIELTDSATYKGNSPANTSFNKIINANVYPNSFANMGSVITNVTGYENRGAIPEWMSSPQSNKKQLGFTRAIVLAHVVPGASKLIAYRLKANGIVFNDLNFVADRYELNNALSSNFTISKQKFVEGAETTFDRIERPGIIATSVTYSVNDLAFDMINNQTVASINALGGIDGVTDYVDGDTLIFAKQENYRNETALHDGWNNGSDVIPGWTEFKNSVGLADGTAGFPASPAVGQVAVVNNVYYQYTVDYDSNGNAMTPLWKIANLRANVWRININNNVVTLTPQTFLRPTSITFNRTFISGIIQAGDRVQINRGKLHSDTVIYYNTILQPELSVPTYTPIPAMLAAPDKNTRFDNYGTRFINNRDIYQLPESGSRWLKFPETGPVL